MTGERPQVHGRAVDPQTRCAHWHGATDIVAIRMFCCGLYYACRDCHAEQAGHPLQPWPKDLWSQPGVLCGACGTELTTVEYMNSGSRCPHCEAAFNPRCSLHWPDYFAVV